MRFPLLILATAVTALASCFDSSDDELDEAADAGDPYHPYAPGDLDAETPAPDDDDIQDDDTDNAPAIERIVAGTDSTGGFPSISADGRFIAFSSDADDLVPGDTNGVEDVFVHDRQNDTTQRVSVSSNGTQGNDQSYAAFISGNGGFVSFFSSASNLGGPGLFVRDLVSGETELVASSSGNRLIYYKSPMSFEGRFVAFEAWSEVHDGIAVYVRDRDMGTTEEIATGGIGFGPSLNADGLFVAFNSDADNLVPGDTNGVEDVFVHYRPTGQITRVSIGSTGGQANGNSLLPALSGDGRFVAFASNAPNLVPGDTNSVNNVFVYDRLTGETTRVSGDSDGDQARFPGFNSISGDGRFIAYESQAGISVYDRLSGETQVVAAGAAPAISGDGRFLAFSSAASDLVPGDDNEAVDIFVVSLESFFDF